jgi:hypothetical protein
MSAWTSWQLAVRELADLLVGRGAVFGGGEQDARVDSR